jgi:hypothetical protein
LSRYRGEELELFRLASNWKGYWSSKIPLHEGGCGLEVGAGIGGNIHFLLPKTGSLMVCEPDVQFCTNHLQIIANNDKRISLKVGTLQEIDVEVKFDQIYYVDVLEHIKEDKLELVAASNHLNSGGSLFILVPAHNFLYSNFDKQVGHFRRYNRNAFRQCTPANLRIAELYYLDSIGFFLSLTNKISASKISISSKKLLFWDKILIPISIKIDWILRYRFGKSILVRMVKDY